MSRGMLAHPREGPLLAPRCRRLLRPSVPELELTWEGVRRRALLAMLEGQCLAWRLWTPCFHPSLWRAWLS